MANQITVADIVSSVTTGQGGQSLITGAPSTGSAIVQLLTIACNQYPAPSPQPVYSSFSLVLSGVWDGELQIEGSADNGATYAPITAQIIGLDSVISEITENCILKGNCAGLTNIRVRATGWVSGTANILFQIFENDDFNNANVINPITVSGTIPTAPESVNTYCNPAGITDSLVQVKGSAGILSSFNFGVNNSDADAYIQFFDALPGDVVLGTTPPKFFVWIPQGGGFTGNLPLPYKFNTAISMAATTTANGDTETSTPIIVPSIGFL